MGAIAYQEYYTYEDFKNWEGDWELIGGVAYAMAPSPLKIHQSLNARIVAQLVESFEECEECEVLVEEDYKIAEETVVRPDISVVCNDENEIYIAKAPLIIVEIISPKTARRDEVVKFSLYEAERVKYYILVYPDDLRAKVYKHNGIKFVKEGDYTKETYYFEECGAKIDFKRVFKRYRR